MRHGFGRSISIVALASLLGCGGDAVPDLPPGVRDLHVQILSTKPGVASGPVRVVYLTNTALAEDAAVQSEARAVLAALTKVPTFAQVTEAWVYPCDSSDCAEHASAAEGSTALRFRKSASGEWRRESGE